MRRNMIVLLAAALLVVAGCKKDNNTEGQKMTFNAGFDDANAKTEISGLDMLWTAGDEVKINGTSFYAKTGGSPSTTLAGEQVEKDGGLYKAYYPAGLLKDGTPTLPATQTYRGTNLSGVNPMYAQSDNTSLLFSNLCAIVKLEVKGTGTVKSIVVSAQEPLSGAFAIREKDPKGFYAELTSKEAATVTLDCSSNTTPLSKETAQIFYIALPQGKYNKLTFTLSNGTKTWATTANEENSITAGKLYTKAMVANLDPSVPKDAIDGLYSVSAEKKVYFSKGNLQYIDNKWRFAEHQYDYLEGYNATKWDHFGWSTNVTNYGMMTSTDAGDYTGEYREWGDAYCAQEHITENPWYTLASVEWDYLFNTRATTYHSFAEVKVSGTCGMLLFPDEFSWPEAAGSEPTIFDRCDVSGRWNSVNYEGAAFAALEEAGCVFLPAAGFRYGELTYLLGPETGYYRASSTNGIVYNIRFACDELVTDYDESSNRRDGLSVRLVCNAKSNRR